ncbi:uncharacterized protein LOC124303384 [Neodiprion virginianus]|uniref:uncharacterized protein LOC124303384 n=1 Tax=Neodiprion virginianus TaxID=2961670 RepID=UPI001EE72310|nr:uncharacterized protein LOC124303384 [Neodiprion virginianus]
MFGNTLRAPELLKNKGITFEAWKKWDKTAETLPHKGQKQYEPNNSWLQNKQIEKGLKDRKDLLGIERVERSSQLATAEWLPLESRARVTKKSGQEWTNFGLEENLELYLIPEEALLLLELNRLELTWEGVALSVQQAYVVLLESNPSKCNIDEYRVYSHLVRQGYRLQRFRYEDDSVLSDMNNPSRRWAKLKRKKQIHDPRGGFGMTRARMSVADSDESIKNDSTETIQDCNPVERGQDMVDNTNDKHNICSLRTEKSDEYPTSSQPGNNIKSRSEINMSNSSETCTRENSEGTNKVEKIIAPLGTNVETAFLPETEKYTLDGAKTSTKKLPSELYDKGVENLPGPSNVEANKRADNQGHHTKLKIISDETILGDIKILSKWPGSRIQRNVKWMPKRNTSGALLPVTERKSSGCTINDINMDGVSPLESLHSRLGGVPKSSRSDKDLENVERPKKVMHEVIEVSDDEIEEVPQKMSRMEMLNLFPNVMCEASLLKPIPRKYLPCNVRPQLSAVRRRSKYYVRSKSKNDDSHENNYNTLPEVRSRLANDMPGSISCSNTISRNESAQVNFNGISVNCRNEVSWQGLSFSKELYESRMMYQRCYNQGAYSRSLPNYAVFREPEHVSVHLRTYTDIAIAQYISGRSPFLRRGFSHRQNIWSNMSYSHAGQNFLNLTPRILCDRVSAYNGFSHFGNSVPQRPTYSHKRGCDVFRYSSRKHYPNRAAEMGRPSFKIVPGALSWAETKAKWLEEKTITIDDEECVNNKDSSSDESEVKVVAQLVKPLVGPQNTTSLTRVYQSLQIIKNITNSNAVRPRKLEHVNYKISYNLYSTGQHYKKASPGTPMYRVVVFRPELTPFIELAEIIRLQQDAKESPIVFACASQTSVTFAELETIKIPDITDI